MKLRNFLFAFVLLAAAGSAVASTMLSSTLGWTRKVDVSVQQSNCEPRQFCEGAGQACLIQMDHDGDPGTPEQYIQLYGFSEQSGQLCAIQLQKN